MPVRETIVCETAFYTLLRFSWARRRAAPRVLLVAPISGMRAPMLYDMLTDLLTGCDLHLLFWKDPVEIPTAAGPFGLDDNIGAVIDAARALGPGTHLIGLCQSALPTLAAASLLSAGGEPSRPVSLALIGGKLDARINPTRLDRLTLSKPLGWFEQNAITIVPMGHPGHGRHVYPASLQEAMLLAYLGRHLLAGGELFAKVMHDDGADPSGHPFLDLLLSVDAVPGEYFLDTISAAFHEFALPRGLLRWRGQPVDPAAITDMALLTIEAEQDDIAAPGQTQVAHDLCRSIPMDRRAHHLQPRIGHFGLFHGAVWHGAILPRLNMLFAHSGLGHRRA